MYSDRMTARAPHERERVRSRARNDLRRGVWVGGTFLPSEAALARRWGSSRSTTRLALLELAAEGLVHQVTGRGWCAGGGEPRQRTVLVINRQDNADLAHALHEILTPAGWSVTTTTTSGLDCSTWADAGPHGAWTDFHAVIYFHEVGLPQPLQVALASAEVRGVAAGCPLQLPYDTVCADYAALSAELIQRCFDQGHRRIAFVGVRDLHRRNPAFATRLHGYRQAMQRLDLPTEVALVESDLSNLHQFGQSFAQWLDACEQRGGRPTCLYLSGPRYVRTIAQVCRDRGLRVPQDISLCGFGAGGEIGGTGLAGFERYVRIEEPWYAVGEAIAARILAHHHSPLPLAACCTLVPGCIQDGDSIINLNP